MEPVSFRWALTYPPASSALYTDYIAASYCCTNYLKYKNKRLIMALHQFYKQMSSTNIVFGY